MNQCLLLLSKLQSILSDEIKWLYFNKLFLLPRQNFWCGDKQVRGEGQELFPTLSFNQIVLKSPLCRSSNLSVSISVSISGLAWVSLPAPRQTRFVFKAILEADLSHLMTDTMGLSLLLLCPVPCASWNEAGPCSACFPQCVLSALQGSIPCGRRPSPSPSTCPRSPWCGSWSGTTTPSGGTLWGRELWPSAASCLVSPPALLGLQTHPQTQGGWYRFYKSYLCAFMWSSDSSSVLLGCFMHHSSKELGCLCF